MSKCHAFSLIRIIETLEAHLFCRNRFFHLFTRHNRLFINNEDTQISMIFEIYWNK